MELLQAISNVGLLRNENEDCVLTCTHPKNEDIKLLVVADGMGGRTQGNIAANEAIAQIEDWFYHEDAEFLNKIDNLDKKLHEKVININKFLIDKYGKDVLGTTLTIAVVGKNKTMILNVGDSRAYIYKNKKVYQITEDDSGVWVFYKSGEVEKDDLRFFPTNNYITACVGLNYELCVSRCYIINNDYDMLLLFTDGVTDLLADANIKTIIDKNKNESILSTIIETAVYKDLKLRVPGYLKRKYKGRFTVPLHGRDNASGAIYIKN